MIFTFVKFFRFAKFFQLHLNRLYIFCVTTICQIWKSTTSTQRLCVCSYYAFWSVKQTATDVYLDVLPVHVKWPWLQLQWNYIKHSFISNKLLTHDIAIIKTKLYQIDTFSQYISSINYNIRKRVNFARALFNMFKIGINCSLRSANSSTNKAAALIRNECFSTQSSLNARYVSNWRSCIEIT